MAGLHNQCCSFESAAKRVDIDPSNSHGFGETRTLAGLVLRRAQANPDLPAFSFLSYGVGDQPETREMSSCDLVARSRSIATGLLAFCQQGDRVLILCPPGLDYVASFFGCLMSGLVAVPAYPPRNAKHMERLEAIINDAGAAAILTHADLTGRLKNWTGEARPLPPIVAVDRLDTSGDGPALPLVAPDDLAFLQYTSGTTGIPKGVMVSHRQLVLNLARIRLLVAQAQSTVFWLPPYHDMGLVGGILYPLFAGIPGVLMSPQAFLRRPLRWLEAISRSPKVATAAPNFAWQLCLDAISDADLDTLDLSSLHRALSGAEPVRYATMQRFCKRFAQCGFRASSFVPVYGMAETVLLTSGTATDRPPTAFAADPQALSTGRLAMRDHIAPTEPVSPNDAGADDTMIVSCGSVIDGHRLRIVDSETLRVCPDDAVGEIWLSGPSVATGYWNRPEETKATFRARLADDPDCGEWLRTGDLGAVVDDELHVLGRIKEMVIVRGCNHYAQDLEVTAASADNALGHDRTIAFGMEEDGKEHVVLVHELTRSLMRTLDAPALAAAIRRAVLDAHEISVGAIVFIKPARLPRTTSGKLQRGKARDLYQSGELAVVAECRSAETEQADISAKTADGLVSWLRAYAPGDINSFEIDERRVVPPSVLSGFARAGLFGLRAPQKLGGLGLTRRDTGRVIEQLAGIDLTLATMVGIHNALGLQPIVQSAPEAQQARWVPELASGRSLACLALTEPCAGSNPRAMRTTARRDSTGQWRLSGEKSWIGLAAWAEVAIVICRLRDEADRPLGFGAFVVERGAPGFRIGPESLTMGVRGIPHNTLLFDNVPVRHEAMLGAPGEGLVIAQRALHSGRLGLAVISLGGMKRCAQLMLRYAQRRRIGTGLLLDNGVTRQRLGTTIGLIGAVEALVAVCTRTLDHGEALPEDLYSVAKISAPEYLWRTADQLVQLLGERGYEEPNEAARILRDARLFRIFDGPTETVGMCLGMRLLTDQADLPDFLSRNLNAVALAERINHCKRQILDAVPNPQDKRREPSAIALAELAAAAALCAMLRHTTDVDPALAEHGETVLLNCMAAAEAQIQTSCRNLPRQPDWLQGAVASFSDAIGETDHQVSQSQYVMDDHLCPEARTRAEEPVQNNQSMLPPAPESAALLNTTGPGSGASPLYFLVRNMLAELCGQSVDSIQPSTGLGELSLDSLLANRMVAKLEEKLGRTLSVRAIFEAPTVSALVAALDDAESVTPSGTIGRIDRSRPLPLSVAQRRALTVIKLGTVTQAFNSSRLLRLEGPVDVGAMNSALAWLVSRHEILRTRYHHDPQSGEFSATIDDPVADVLVIRQPDQDQTEDVRRLAIAEASRTIDIFREPAFRPVLFRVSQNESYLALRMHHIACDARSVSVLWQDLTIAYEAFGRGLMPDVPVLPIQYADYAAWEAEQRTAELLASLRRYWQDVLAGAPALTNLPSDRPRPVVQSERAAIIHRRLPEDLMDAVQQLSRTTRFTPFLVFETGLAIVCGMLTGGNDVVIGTVGEGRLHHQLTKMVGNFVTTVPLRHAIDPSSPVRTLLANGRERMMSAFENDRLAFDEIVAAVAPPRRAAFDPVFQVFCQLRTGLVPTADVLSGMTIEQVPLGMTGRAADLSVVLDQSEGATTAEVSYSTDLFERDTVEVILDLHIELVQRIASDPDERTDTLWADTVSAVKSRCPSAAVEKLIGKRGPEAGMWYPLSGVQQDLWLTEQSTKSDRAMASLAILTCPPDLDVERLETVLRGGVMQAQSNWLRLSKQGLQSVGSEPTTDVSIIRVVSLDTSGAGPRTVLAWHEERNVCNDGRSDLAIFVAPEAIVVAARSPHVWHDGWSSRQFFERTCELFDRLGREPDYRFELDRLFLPSLREEQLYRWSTDFQTDMDYWHATVDAIGSDPLIHSLADRPQHFEGSPQVRSTRLSLDSCATMIAKVCQLLKLTPAELMTGLTAVYLAKLTSEEEIVLSVPFLNRDWKMLRVPGQFANAVPVRMEVAAQSALRLAVEHAARNFKTALRHGRVPFGDIVRNAGLDPRHGDVSINTLFTQRGLTIDGRAAWIQWLRGPESGLSFLLTQIGKNAPLELEVRHNRLTITAESAFEHCRRLAGFLDRALKALMEPDCARRVRDVPILDEMERFHLIARLNDTVADYPNGRSVVSLFAEQASACPDAVAVIEGDCRLSFAQLDAASNRMARHLLGLGVEAETVVGVCLERSSELIVTLLAIWKAGGAYLPLDPNDPSERISFMLTDADASVLITRSEMSIDCDGLPSVSQVLLDDSSQPESITNQSAASIVGQYPGNNALAYLIYTSGSTGRPKGVMISHGNLTNYLNWAGSVYRLPNRAIVPITTSVAFDATVTSMWLPLVSGSSVVLPGLRDVGEVYRTCLARLGFNLVKTTPTQLSFLHPRNAFDVEDVGAPGLFVIGGEELDATLLDRLRQSGCLPRIINEYGPTEATVGCVVHEISGEGPDAGPVPIGRPVPNTQIYVVNRDLDPQPIGIPGELLIGGLQVARGYLGRPALTAEKFVADPFSSEPGSRLYRTGDLARWRSDGTLQFLGRIDSQIKIRGMRVEPGEIEAALLDHPAISKALVVPREDESLVAYLVPVGAHESPDQPDERTDGSDSINPLALDGLLDLGSLRSQLSHVLPAHMLPSGFVGLTRLPLTTSGKIDRKSLPDSGFSAVTAAYVAPRSAMEKMIAGIMADLLGVERIGANDDFFKLGGHSLMAVRFVARLEAETGRSLPVRAMFEATTVAGIASLLDDGGMTPVDWTKLMLADAALGGELHSVQSDCHRGVSQCHAVLLTGATGFLGRYLLKELLEAGVPRIWCLMRANAPDKGLRRIRSVLAEISCKTDGLENRLEVVCGDIAEKGLGLTPDDWERLALDCDGIVHNGADVNFVKSYGDLRAANVLSVAELLKLAAADKSKTLHFVSTLSVFGDARGFLPDPGTPADLPVGAGGYAQSKWVAEQILMSARKRGFDIAIYRPGLIVGDSRTGWYGTDDGGTAFLSLALDIGFVPEVDRHKVFAINVDRAAQKIIRCQPGELSLDPNFNIVDPAEIAVSDLIRAAHSAGLKLQKCSLQAWLTKVNVLLGNKPDHRSAWLVRALSDFTTGQQADVRTDNLSSSFRMRGDVGGGSGPSLEMPLRWFAARKLEQDKEC